MASKVKLDPERLQDLLAQTKQLQQECDSRLSDIKNARAELDWDVPEREQVDSELNELCRRLSAQRGRLDSIVYATNMAISESDNANGDITRNIEMLAQGLFGITALTGLAGVAAAGVIASNSANVLNGLFGMHASIASALNETLRRLREWIQSVIVNTPPPVSTIIDGNTQTGDTAGNEVPEQKLAGTSDTGTSSGNAQGAGIHYYTNDKKWNGTYYNSADWGKYDSVADRGGCGVSCAAMVASHFGMEYTPEQLTDANGANLGINQIPGLTRASTNMAEGYTQQQMQELLDQKLNLYLSDPQHNSPPVAGIDYLGNHYVVIVGKNEDGSYTIVDPNLNSKSRLYIKDLSSGVQESGNCYVNTLKQVVTYTKK